MLVCRCQTKQEIAPPLHVVERYIELLCRYEPEQVYMFLKSSDNYRLEEALEVSLREAWLRCTVVCACNVNAVEPLNVVPVVAVDL